MVNYLLKKSYLLKNLEEVNFQDLWEHHGIFTTMRIIGNPPKILFFDDHIHNLINSLKKYRIKKRSIKKDIIKIINQNLSKKINYNHLLRIAVSRNIISISLRKRLLPKLNFNLKLVNLKRNNPRYKNLKYRKILSYLLKIDSSVSDIGIVNKKKLLETGTSNLLFVKDKKIYSPLNNFYEGITLKFFKSKIKKIIKKDIYINTLKNYDEIILLGSGKGVVSVKSIDQIQWRRKSKEIYNKFLKLYLSAINKCKKYN